MSRSQKNSTLSQLEDTILGVFSHVPSSETLDHLVRYLSTWSGSDKLFMIIQYSLKIIVPFLHLRARLQHQAGLRKEPISAVAPHLAKLGNLVGDARMLNNIWGLLPIIRWLINLERNPPPTRNLLTIERLQGWAMLGYYPLEHLYYLVSNSVIPAQVTIRSPSSLVPFAGTEGKEKLINLDAGVLSRASTRLWALYVFLQLAHLREDRRLLNIRQRALSKTKAEKEELRQRWDALWSEVIVNVSNVPLTIHWSLERGLFENEVWVGIFGLVAALASWRSGWKATALPASVPRPDVQPFDVEKPPLEESSEKVPPVDLDSTEGTLSGSLEDL
ncbi:unnamed protein product [Somion occarium]|uniref:Uncharacterized protein n=1 Tax=Somion occarium TaxID=3059160 RepID=A0ABP1EAP0_9APHY